MVRTENLKEKTPLRHKVLTIIGIALCIVLIPILAVNITLIVRSYTNTEEVPKVNGYSPLIVLTGSMEPAIDSGDLIIVQQIDSSEVQVGDVIAFFDPDSDSNSVVTHRVSELVTEDGNLSFRTKGDANNVEDDTLVPCENLVGIYRTRFSGLGNVAMFMQTTLGLVICVIVPLVLFVTADLIRHRQFENQNQQDTAQLLAELEALKAQKALDGQKDKTRPNDDDVSKS
jgi:signal peptidase